MPAHPLRPFAPSRSRDLAVEFDARRLADGFAFRFQLSGRPPDLIVPAIKSPAERRRADELWRHTCFEFFAGPAAARRYLEFNLAPSGDWNAYTFDEYRTGMRPCDGGVAAEASRDGDTWSGTLRGTPLPAFFGAGPVVMGASVVLEYSDGLREYWALAHAAAQPDFHHRGAFVLTLATERTP